MVLQWNKKGKQYVVVKTFGIYFNETVTSIITLKGKQVLETEITS